jgi:hypothetical protein
MKQKIPENEIKCTRGQNKPRKIEKKKWTMRRLGRLGRKAILKPVG